MYYNILNILITISVIGLIFLIIDTCTNGRLLEVIKNIFKK
jgi:hypothetical protein